MLRLIHRLRSMSAARRRLLAEAVRELAFVSAALAVLPFRRAIRLGERVSRDHAGIDPRDAAWAVAAAARRVPWRTVCIQQGIALHRMLRRRGLDATLHYGIGRTEGSDLNAHVWVSLAGEVLIGGEAAAQVREVARYPSSTGLSTLS